MDRMDGPQVGPQVGPQPPAVIFCTFRILLLSATAITLNCLAAWGWLLVKSCKHFRFVACNLNN